MNNPVNTEDVLHAVKDPVNEIIRMTDILRRTELSGTQTECVQVIDGNAHELKKLLEALDLHHRQDQSKQKLHVFNRRDLLNRVGNTIEIAEEVLHNIRESLPEHLQQCRTAWEQRNIHDLRQIAHTIKGSAGTAGAEIVADRAGKITKLIRDATEDQDILGSLLDELEKAVATFLHDAEHNTFGETDTMEKQI